MKKPISEADRLSENLPVKFTKAQLKLVRGVAAEKGYNYPSQLIREVIMDFVERYLSEATTVYSDSRYSGEKTS